MDLLEKRVDEKVLGREVREFSKMSNIVQCEILQHFSNVFRHLLATRFPTTGPSALFPCRLASNDKS